MDSGPNLTRDARRLLAHHIESPASLDLLLLFHGRPAHEWTVQEICAAVNCPTAWAQAELAGLSEAGLVVAVGPGRWRYVERSPFAAAVDELARVAREHRAALARAIFVPRTRRRLAT